MKTGFSHSSLTPFLLLLVLWTLFETTTSKGRGPPLRQYHGSRRFKRLPKPAAQRQSPVPITNCTTVFDSVTRILAANNNAGRTEADLSPDFHTEEEEEEEEPRLDRFRRDTRRNTLYDPYMKLFLDFKSRAMSVRFQEAKSALFSEVISRTNERHFPDYYLDEVQRDYFTEYHGWFAGDDYSVGDVDHVKRFSQSNFTAKFEKQGGWSEILYFEMMECLTELGFHFGDQSEKYSFAYKNRQVNVFVQVDEAWSFQGRRLQVDGGKDFPPAYVTLPMDVGNGSNFLQVQLLSTDINPFVGDPSITFHNSPIVSLDIIDSASRLHLVTSQELKLRLPWNESRSHFNAPRTKEYSARVMDMHSLGPEDFLVWKTSLFDNMFVSIELTTEIPDLQLHVVVMRQERPAPYSFCDTPARSQYTQIWVNGKRVYLYHPITFKTTADDHHNLSDYFIGVLPKANRFIAPVGSTVNFTLMVFRYSCLIRDDGRRVWSENSCLTSITELPVDHINCSCNHLSTYSAAKITSPTYLISVEPLDFVVSLRDNYFVPALVSGFVLLSLVVLIILLVMELRGRSKGPGIHIMADPKLGMEQHFYLISVVSGGLFRSRHTSSNVSLQIYGSRGSSVPYVLREDAKPVKTLRNNSMDTFLVSSSKSLGALEKIRIWRDDHGRHPDWYCRRVVIQCLKSRELYSFVVNKSFSLGLFGNSISHEVRVMTELERTHWKSRLSQNIYDGLQNWHPWLSIWTGSPSIKFSSCERFLCAVSVLFAQLVLIYEYHRVFHKVERVESGGLFQLQWVQLLVALYAFGGALPLELLLRFLFGATKFRRVRTLLVWTSEYRTSWKNAQVFGYYDQAQPTHSEISPLHFSQQGGKLEETTRFSIPPVHVDDTERWLYESSQAPTTPTVISYKDALPNEFIRCVVDRGGGGGDEEKGHHHPQPEEGRIPWKSFMELRKENELAKEEAAQQQQQQQQSQLPTGQGDCLGPEEESPNFPAFEVVQVNANKQMKLHVIVQILMCMQSPRSSCCYLFPYCFSVLWWILCILLILASALSCAYFGLQLGPILTWRIFSDFLLSVLLSALVFQPLLIVVVAIIKMIHISERDVVSDARFQVRFLNGAPELSQCCTQPYTLFIPERAHPPLTEAETIASKIKATRANHANRQLIRIAVHVLLMVLYMVISYMNFSEHDYLLVRSLQSVLQVKEMWAYVSSPREFYEYMHHLIEHELYPLTMYGHEEIPYFNDVPIFLRDQSSMMVGVPRLHLFRAGDESPCTPSSYATCSSEVFLGFDTRDYGPKWVPLNGSNRREYAHGFMWKYVEDTKSFRTFGKLLYYPSGGYLAYLGRNFYKSFSVLHYLRNQKWIDGRVRGIVLELSTYNPNTNLFVYTKLIAEISGSGTWLTWSSHFPLTLTRPSHGSVQESKVFLVLFVLLGVALLLSVVLQIVEWVVYRKIVYASIFLIVLTFISLLIGYNRLSLVQDLKLRLNRMLVNEHIPMDEVCFWDKWQEDFFGLTFAVACVTLLLHSFKLRKEFFMVYMSLKLSFSYLVYQMLYMILILMSFASWGCLWFGSKSWNFHSVPRSFITLLERAVNNSIFSNNELDSAMGRIFSLVFMVAVFMVGMNLLISILDEGFLSARRIAQQKKYWMWMSIFKFFRKLFPSSPKAHFKSYPIIHPSRLLLMESKTSEFLRDCLETALLQRKQQMYERSQAFLNPRGLSLVSSNSQRKRLRERKRLEQRLNTMRVAFSYMLLLRNKSVLTRELAQAHSEFSQTILDLKVGKLERKLEQLGQLLEKITPAYSRTLKGL